MVIGGHSTTAWSLEGRTYSSPLVKQELAKLGRDAESTKAALRSLRAVVEEQLQGQALLRFIHQIEESVEGRRHAATVLGDLARVHGARLLPHIPRLLRILAHTLLASAACPALQLECAKAVAAIARYAIASSPLSEEAVLKRLCLPLIALLSCKVEILSAGAAACLGAVVESKSWEYASPPLISKLCLKASTALTSKSSQTVPHLSLLRMLATVNSDFLAQFGIPLLRLLNHEVLVCPSSSWQLRVAAIRLIEVLFKVLNTVMLAPHLAPLLATLAKLQLDKMSHVRRAAISALRSADGLVGRNSKIPNRVGGRNVVQPQATRKSPSHHGQETLAITNIKDFINGDLVSQELQHSQDLLVSSRLLTELTMDSASRKQHGNQTLSEYDQDGATTNVSDYFCAYFFDTKENVPSQKIVHNINGAVTESTAKIGPKVKTREKVRVPPLPLSKVLRRVSSGKIINGRQSRNGAHSCMPKHVTAVDSRDGSDASPKQSSLSSASEEDIISQREVPSDVTKGFTNLQLINASETTLRNSGSGSPNTDFTDHSSHKQSNGISEEEGSEKGEFVSSNEHDIAHQGTTCCRIQGRIEDAIVEEENSSKEHAIAHQGTSCCRIQGRIEDAIVEEENNTVTKEEESEKWENLSSKKHVIKQQEESSSGLKGGIEGPFVEGEHDTNGSSTFDGLYVRHEQPQSIATKKQCEVRSKDGARKEEFSRGDWIWCHNPIAYSQVSRPSGWKMSLERDMKHKYFVDYSFLTSCQTANEPSEQTATDFNMLLKGLRSSKEAVDQRLECHTDGACENENCCRDDRLYKGQLPVTMDPMPLDDGYAMATHGVIYTGEKHLKLRFFAARTACVIFIVIFTMAKLLHSEYLPQEASVSNHCILPT
ncbi:hypothetical protein KP509_06G014600 [Ceratopteris richardii]|uniref:TORTIFOLIA1/SINE1-2 N-terminal domain-containing protein n=1 Tax=Ceratopteris richardii TaxID=49495 RepID=A0A8T2UI80_CERRI|nr:hypothetical protein KP509_06G014600 [Ceratopteris richardii]